MYKEKLVLAFTPDEQAARGQFVWGGGFTSIPAMRTIGSTGP